MAIRRLNHAVLYVRDVARSVTFYTEVLGFRPVHLLPGAAFLCAPDSDNDHDLGLFEIGAAARDSPAGKGSVGLYHLAWAVGTLADLADYAARLRAAGMPVIEFAELRMWGRTTAGRSLADDLELQAALHGA
jgi:catechol 2,3-dioxygenase-like lactoylglutathione lyase family enzyme